MDLNNYKNTLIISAFPGIGKSYVKKLTSDTDLNILDLSISDFAFLVDELKITHLKKDDTWINEYINCIEDNIGIADIIFIDLNFTIRKILIEKEIFHYVVYPPITMKNEILQRYKDNDQSKCYIDAINNDFSKIIDSINQTATNSKYEIAIELKPGEYVIDKIDLTHTPKMIIDFDN